MSAEIPIVLTRRAAFIPHNGFTRKMSRDDIFAECLAEGDTATEAARRAGFCPSNASHHAMRLRKKMGEQE